METEDEDFAQALALAEKLQTIEVPKEEEKHDVTTDKGRIALVCE